jgi:transaldolase
LTIPLLREGRVKMKFFIDTANVKEIREAHSLGVIDGVTTNPTLVSREGRPFEEVIKEICSIVDGPISAEVVSLESEGMVKEARKLSKMHKNIVTLCFSPTQAILAAKAGGSFISPFVGRLDDISHNGMDLVRQIKTIYGNYGFKTEIIVASIRHPLHVVEAALAGADIATIPFKVIDSLLKHPLTDIGVERFLKDWEKVPKK